jgi:predicted secreted protein
MTSKLFAPLSILVCLSAAPALAGDVAELNILGFSADGKVFAFEEYGIQDGSGFPYANRFYIDVATDQFVAGTPIRARIEDESASLADARAKAREGAAALVSDDELMVHRGTTAGFNPVTELSADPHRMQVNPRPVFAPIDPPFEVRLEELNLGQPQNCEGLTDAKGFRLTRVGVAAGESASVLHEDETIPQSRACPTGYQIGAVQTFYPQSGDPVFAVMIAVRSFGFEGPDYRWIAVPGRL